MRPLVPAVVVALLIHVTMADSNLPISHASNTFASQLYQELAKTPGNVLVCPLSIHIALALVHQGAGGTTRSELGQALHLGDSNDSIKNGFKTLLSGLQDDVLKIATKLYPANSFTPKPDYVSLAQQYFLSEIQPLDYTNPSNAAKTINKFVEDKTNNKIHDIIKPDSLSDLTRLVIINAVHFKAGWAKTFPPAFPLNFKVTPTESIQTDFLALTDFFPYNEDPALGAKILKMDYEGGKYSMVFVLPTKEGGLRDLELKLANTSMDHLLSGLKDSRVEVTIPKFKIEMEMQLKDTLMKMGINSMFDSRADLSNLAQGENLHVDSVIQKTFIDVNEKGTEAAAATGIVTPLSGGSEEKTFFARTPFCYYLINNIKAVIIFNGRLVRPMEKLINPPKTSSNIQKYKPTGMNVNVNNENLNRFMGNEQNIFGHNPGIGTNPNIHTSLSSGQNFNPQQQNYGQPNRYATSERPQLIYGQNIGSSIHHGQRINPQSLPQNSPTVRFGSGDEYAAPLTYPSNHDRGRQAAHQYNQPPTGQLQYHNKYQQPLQSNYDPQYQAYS